MNILQGWRESGEAYLKKEGAKETGNGAQKEGR